MRKPKPELACKLTAVPWDLPPLTTEMFKSQTKREEKMARLIAKMKRK